jgi:hypothetical protein
MPKRIFLKENVVVGSNPPGGYKSLELNTSGDLSLKSSGGTVSAVSGGSDIFVFQNTTQSDNTETLTDTDLFFTADANSTYIVDLSLIMSTEGGLNAKISTTNSPNVYGTWTYVDGMSSGYNWIITSYVPFTDDYTIYVPDSGNARTMNFSFLVKTTASSLVKLQFRSYDINGGDTAYIYQGSWLKVTKVS